MKTMNILIVDDDSRVQSFLGNALRAEGHAATSADAPAEASNPLSHGEFDLVLLDPEQPREFGPRLCREIRRRDDDIGILILTATDRHAEKAQLLRTGADDYVTKPFNLDELLARIEAVTRRRARAPVPSVTRVGDLEIDHEAQAIRAGDIPLDLTRKEYGLLRMLMKAESRPVSREKILNQVWGYSSAPLTNVVDVYVARVRRKLADAAARARIRTVHGVGYRLEHSDGGTC